MLDATGEPMGKVRDVVVSARERFQPRVRGLVVDMLAKRRIFIPMTRVHAIDATQISITGMVDARRFARRGSETLVSDDLFDRTITRLMPGHDGTGQQARRAVIVDVAMAEVRSHSWALVEVALREIPAKWHFGITPKGPVVTVAWSEVGVSVWTAEQNTDAKLAQLADMKPADVARELHDMDPQRRAEVAQALDDEQLADAFQEMPEDEQVDLLVALDSERAADVLDEMDPDDAADLINDLPDEMAEDLLARMQPEEAQDVRNLLKYEELTAGGMMTPEPVILSADATVAEALAHVRDEELTPALSSMVFITRSPYDTPSGRYLGAVHIQRLLREPPSLMASAMIDEDLSPVSPDTDLYDLSRYFATYNLVIAPVVNENSQLVGAVTVDDLLDHMLPIDWRGDQLDGDDDGVVSDGQ